MLKQRILVVDDDKSIVRILRGYLEQAGYEVLMAYDGKTALHGLRREKPELLLLDLMLPSSDGWDLTRLIRADTTLAALPIIMLTARVDDMDKIIGLELGADDYITKPFNAREVVARIRALLRRCQMGNLPATPILEVGRLRLDVGAHQLYLNGDLEHPGYTFTREDLLERWAMLMRAWGARSIRIFVIYAAR
jgi:two-component system alkaline phosphatase synthesis response regulator PhoP